MLTSHSHITNPKMGKELEPYIKAMYLSGTKIRSTLNLFHGMTYKDKIYIRISTSSRNDCLPDEFARQLDNENISYEYLKRPGHGYISYTPDYL